MLTGPVIDRFPSASLAWAFARSSLLMHDSCPGRDEDLGSAAGSAQPSIPTDEARRYPPRPGARHPEIIAQGLDPTKSCSSRAPQVDADLVEHTVGC
jgi:hypothetical protein